MLGMLFAAALPVIAQVPAPNYVTRPGAIACDDARMLALARIEYARRSPAMKDGPAGDGPLAAGHCLYGMTAPIGAVKADFVERIHYAGAPDSGRSWVKGSLAVARVRVNLMPAEPDVDFYYYIAVDDLRPLARGR